MNHPSDDPDDLVQKRTDLNHVAKMTNQMHVPDSITVGPIRSNVPRIHQDEDRPPIRMEVPSRLRPGGNGSMMMLNDTDFFTQTDNTDLSNSIIQQPSLPSVLHPKDIEANSDDEYASININHNQHNHASQITDSWYVEPHQTIDDKNILNKIQLLQNRIHHIERKLARRDNRDRLFYSCVFGYVFLQLILSIRRSMLN